MRDEDRTMTSMTPADRHRTLRNLGALVGLSVALGACNYTGGELVTASVPDDYRLRHPIAVQEADRSIVIFVGHARGGLSAPQRADVMGLAQIWVREGTGAIVAGVPASPVNFVAARSSGRSSNVRDDPVELSENLCRGGTLRRVAGGSRTLDSEQSLQRKQAVLQFRLR